MAILAFEEMVDLQIHAIEHGLSTKRQQLLASVNPIFVASLDTAPDPRGQLILDLNAMNNAGKIVGEVVPLLVWLLQAKFLSAPFPDRQRYYDNLAEQVAKRASHNGADGMLGVYTESPAKTLPERIIYKNDLVASAFIAGAARTATCVARVSVPQLENGEPRLNPSSGDPMSALGSGWLIGPQHLITNWHVIEGRTAGEAAPSEADLRQQCAGAVAEFDYDGPDTATHKVQVAELAHGDPALDYAVLKLELNPGRGVLPLRQAELSVDPADPFPVNVVQHPGGGFKQFGIRNNLVVAVDGADLAYFTDTAGGSSGSPVCDDQWRVVALHKASSLKFGLQSFQGKTTAWVNVGTPIHSIIRDITRSEPKVWEAIAPKLV